MSVIYVAEPLNSECLELLDEYEIECNESAEGNRNPTVAEVKDACESLTDFNIKSGFINDSWQLDIVSEDEELWTLIHIHEVTDEHDIGTIVFENGKPELILTILKTLSKVVGVFMLVPDTGEDPLVVSSSIDIAHALKAWSHTMEYDDFDDE